MRERQRESERGRERRKVRDWWIRWQGRGEGEVNVLRDDGNLFG